MSRKIFTLGQLGLYAVSKRPNKDEIILKSLYGTGESGLWKRDDFAPVVVMVNGRTYRYVLPANNPRRVDMRKGTKEMRGMIVNPYRINPLDGMTNQEARKKVSYMMSHYTHGIFSDESWVPVNAIWKVFNDIGLDWSMTNSFYRRDVDTGEPKSKVWEFEIRFHNKNHKLTTMYGSVTAYGAGTVADPLSRYDLVAQVF